MSNCRLVQIEVRDFKSFAGSHLIGPFEDFTGIVGPNGSGKSNVLDSLAFVFYLDQNPRSTSYIHSVIGTARVDDCSVRVYIEEEEGKKKKKKVTHTYQRDYDSIGNSKLYIDDKEVDESDYLKIIAEKGFIPLIFVKQAEVDSIARKTPIELTQLFEEISGSIEYAKRYDELRIESEASHEAVSMIEKRRRAAISERKHISDRKTEADNFKRLQEQEEEIQVKSFLLQLYHITKQINDKEKKINELLQKIAELEEESNDANEKHMEIERDKLKTSKNLVKIDEKYKEIEQAKRDANANKIQFVEKQTMLIEQLGDAKKRFEHSKNAENQLKIDLEDYQKKKVDIENELTKLKPVEEIETQIAEYNSLREQASKQFDDITQALRLAMKERSEALRETNNIKEQIDSLESSKKKKEDLLDQYKDSLEKEEKKYAQVHQEVRVKEGEKELNKKQISHDSDLLTKKNQTLREKEKQIDEIRRIQGTGKRKDRFEKQLTKMTQFIPGVYGLFSDLVQPIRSEYDTAAEAGCRAFKDSIVVKDSKTAIRCLKFLSESGYGDAKLLPLNNLKPVKVQTKKGINLLSNLMECESLIKPALNYVCGHIAVADNIEKAKNLAFSEKIIVVTLDGTIIDPRGIMTGGSTKNKPKYSEKNLEKKLVELENEKAALEKDIGSLGDRISQTKSQLEANEESLFTLTPQLKHREKQMELFKKRISQTEVDIRQYKRQLSDLNDKKEKAMRILKEKEDEVAKVNFTQSKNDKEIFDDFCRKVGVKNVKEFEITRLQDFEERYSKRLELESRLSQYTNWISDIENKSEDNTIQNFESQVEDFENQLNDVNNKVTEYKKEYQRLCDELDNINKERQQILDEDASNQSEAKEQRKKCNLIMKKLEKCRDEKNNADHEREAAIDKRKSILQQCRLSNINLPKIESSEEDESEEMSHTPSSATQENIDHNEVEKIDFIHNLSAAERSMSQKDVRKQTEEDEKNLEEIRRKIKQIRPDLKSDKRYTEVEVELKKIEKEQDEKRQKAAQTKKEFIEVKTLRRDKFMQLYETVDQHIDKIYKKLTRVRNHENRSGTAYLSLEDTEEPYLGGIKYTAMPPHKRFRDLEQLSGGEKAVASLALIIALQKFKDSPFIMMDEPDASLDKLNLRAAADALSEISKTTQIVSVSLRDRFFEYSDALVGVYKDKNNQSSGILTLNLNQFVDQNLEMEALDE